MSALRLLFCSIIKGAHGCANRSECRQRQMNLGATWRKRGRSEAEGSVRTKEDEPEGAGEASRARGAARERDDAIVLREGCVWRRGEEARDARVNAVGEKAALHARVEVGARRRHVRRHAGARDVARRLSG
eukprot:6195095-Pleurochrysis_carterae.AAC.2